MHRRKLSMHVGRNISDHVKKILGEHFHRINRSDETVRARSTGSNEARRQHAASEACCCFSSLLFLMCSDSDVNAMRAWVHQAP